MSSVIIAGNTSGTITLDAPNVAGTTTLTLPTTSGTVITNTAGTVTQTMLAAGVVGNGPAFSATSSSTVTLTSGIWAKIIFNVEGFDTNNNYDPTTNYRFTPTVAGYYQINACVSSGAVTNTNIWTMAIYKNGSGIVSGSQNANNATNGAASMCSSIIYCNGSTDYIEIYAVQTSGTNISTGTGIGTFFNGFLARSA